MKDTDAAAAGTRTIGPVRGSLYVGTSGFAYPGWVPSFYPRGTRGEEMLHYYAERLAACELNNTYYQHPSPERIGAWMAETPDSFRFAVKAHRTGSQRAFRHDPSATLPWLTRPFLLFGARLCAVLLRVAADQEHDDRLLDRFLTAWGLVTDGRARGRPGDPPSGSAGGLPLALEFQHPSWLDDAVIARLRASGAVLCVTELGADPVPPPLYVTGPFLYLRLRRDDYSSSDLAAWAERLVPFLEDGRDAYVFFKHDERGRAPALALELREMVTSLRSGAAVDGLPRASRGELNVSADRPAATCRRSTSPR